MILLSLKEVKTCKASLWIGHQSAGLSRIEGVRQNEEARCLASPWESHILRASANAPRNTAA